MTAHYNRNSSSIQPLIAEFGSSKVQSIQADLSKEADVARLFLSSSQAPFGPVQIIIVNHGIFPEAYVALVDMTFDQWNTTLNANLTSTFFVTREYLKQLERVSDVLKEKAAVVFVGSVTGTYGAAGHGDYASAKSGMFRQLELLFPPFLNFPCSDYVRIDAIAEKRNSEDCTERQSQHRRSWVCKNTYGGGVFEKSRNS